MGQGQEKVTKQRINYGMSKNKLVEGSLVQWEIDNRCNGWNQDIKALFQKYKLKCKTCRSGVNELPLSHEEKSNLFVAWK